MMKKASFIENLRLVVVAAFASFGGCAAAVVVEEGRGVVDTSVPSMFPKFKPLQIPYDALLAQEITIHHHAASFTEEGAAMQQEASFLLWNALEQVGMVSITNIPHLKELKAQALSWEFHACTLESPATQSHTYPDGTHRRTLATHTLPGGAYITLNHKTQDSTACQTFADASEPFREAVDSITRLFAARLTSLVRTHQEEVTTNTPPLLMTRNNYPFSTISDIVEHGEHLEHFHSYQHFWEQPPAENQDPSQNDDHTSTTMEMHTDQGLFLVFSPGRLIRNNKDNNQVTLSTGFTIELADGSQALVDFDEEDDLVILLGDGVHQYINPRLKNGNQEAFFLRAVPHALALPTHSKDEARVWYGRMVLPPSSAIHPWHDKTFGELREALIQASTTTSHSDPENLEALALGCSSSSPYHHHSLMIARQLEEESCQADTLYCWHKCMSLADYNVSQEACQAQGKQVLCINPRGQLTDGDHGDYFPGCATNDTEIATPFPTLPDYPRDNLTCTNASFLEFANSMPYQHQIELGGGGAIFLWNVSEDDGGHVQGRMVYNGLLGYLAFGLANVGGDKNGMHGANIIMAIPGGDYSPVTGFNLSIDPSIQEYQISTNPDQSAFRFWGMTGEDGTTAQARHSEPSTELDITDCFSSFAFETGDINGVPFNLSGVDQLLWAANDIDYFAGYHGMNRGRFSIHWPTGEGKLYQAPTEPTESSSASHTSSQVIVWHLLWWSVSIIIGVLGYF